MKSTNDIIKAYPYATISTFMGIISLFIMVLIYIGMFDVLVPLKEQGGGIFNFIAKNSTPQKTIVDHLNMVSMIIAIIGLMLSFFSYLKKEEKIASKTAAIACFLPLFFHFLLVCLAIAVIIAIINSPIFSELFGSD